MQFSTKMSKPRYKWIRVSSKNPCIVCGKPNWCLYRPSVKAGEIYVICMRKAGGNSRITYIDGKPAYHHLVKGNYTAGINSPDVPESKIASPRTRDAVYRIFLDGRLKKHHRSYLIARGFKEDTIFKSLYTSMPDQNEHDIIVDKLLQNMPLDGIPGFYTKNNEWKIKYLNGILLPVINCDGLIVGCQINTEAAILSYMLYKNKGLPIPESSKAWSKYIWLSSSSEGKDGTGAEASPHFVGITGGGLLANLDNVSEINIVEGVLKSGMVNQLTGKITIGQPGVGIGTNAVVQYIVSNPQATVNIAYDMDWKTNEAVFGALKFLINRIKESRNGLDKVNVLSWQDDVKGYDDALAIGINIDSTPAGDWMGVYDQQSQ